MTEKSPGLAAEAVVFLVHGRHGILSIGDAYTDALKRLADQLPTLGFPMHFPRLSIGIEDAVDLRQAPR